MILLFSTCKKETDITNTESTIRYKPYGLTYLHDFVVTKSGDLLLLGESTNQIQLTKAKSSGELIWQKNIDLLPEHDVDYTIHNVVENADESILVFGTQSKIKGNNNFAIFKLKSNGENIGTKTFFLAKNDTAAPGVTYSTHHYGIYTKDQEGGYFIQLRLSEGSSIGAARSDYIIHYDSKDSIDQIVDPMAVDPSYFATQYEIQANKDNGSLILLRFDYDNTGNYFIEKLDNLEFIKGKILKKWSTPFPVINGWIRGYFDDKNFYTCNLLTNDSENETKGMQIAKLDLNTGAKLKEWLVPFQQEIRDNGTLSQPWSIISDETHLYMPVAFDNHAFILKSSKEGMDYKLIPMGGDISRDLILKIGLNGDQILVFGYGSLNRSKEQILYMCSINKNGYFIGHE